MLLKVLMQKTDFPLEVIHDDASTDGTADIIGNTKPNIDIIKPICKLKTNIKRNKNFSHI